MAMYSYTLSECEAVEPVLKRLQLVVRHAPINVFPDTGEAGRTRAFDSSSQPVGDFDFI